MTATDGNPLPGPPPASQVRGKHWVWGGVDKNAKTDDLKKRYAQLKSRGIGGVFIGGGLDDREFDILKNLGMEVHCWMWTTNRGESWIREYHPDWFMVSRSGKSCFDKPPYVDYYRWVSPAIPQFRRYLADRVAELAEHPAVSGVHLDYVRFPDVILPRALWKQYNVDQTEELPDFDFCYGEHTLKAFREVSGRDPRELKNPGADQEWVHFRQNLITLLVAELREVAHRHGKQITAAVFPTPALARTICRQSWDDWELDAVCPMVYNSFYNEPVSWIGDCVREDVQAVRFPVFAGLYLPGLEKPKEFGEAVKLALRRGAAGVSLFGGVSDAHWKEFEEAIKG